MKISQIKHSNKTLDWVLTVALPIAQCPRKCSIPQRFGSCFRQTAWNVGHQETTWVPAATNLEQTTVLLTSLRSFFGDRERCRSVEEASGAWPTLPPCGDIGCSKPVWATQADLMLQQASKTNRSCRCPETRAESLTGETSRRLATL